jgi:hypothetical protein
MNYVSGRHHDRGSDKETSALPDDPAATVRGLDERHARRHSLEESGRDIGTRLGARRIRAAA